MCVWRPQMHYLPAEISGRSENTLRHSVKQEPSELFRAWIDSNHCWCCNKFIVLHYSSLVHTHAFFPLMFSSDLQTFTGVSTARVPSSLQLVCSWGIICFRVILLSDLSNSWWLAWAKYQGVHTPPNRLSLSHRGELPFLSIRFCILRPRCWIFASKRFYFLFPFKSCK